MSAMKNERDRHPVAARAPSNAETSAAVPAEADTATVRT